MTTLVRIGRRVVDVEDVTSMPDDREFRDAWQISGDVIEIDMHKARRIAQDEIRAARADLFKLLDRAAWLAMEGAGDMKTVATKKQVLRDAPADIRIAQARTSGELEATIAAVTAAMKAQVD